MGVTQEQAHRHHLPPEGEMRRALSKGERRVTRKEVGEIGGKEEK
jgi:hypothetical protein